MADQGRSDVCVVFTMSLCALELKQTVISLLNRVYTDLENSWKIMFFKETHGKVMEFVFVILPKRAYRLSLVLPELCLARWVLDSVTD